MSISGLMMYFFLLVPVSGTENPTVTDFLKVTMSGNENLVMVNNVHVFSGTVPADSLHMSGEIVQTGKSNCVEICSATSANATGNKIHITQTGKNNSIKINSQ